MLLASPPTPVAWNSYSNSLSVALHRFLRPRLTFCRSPFQKNPSPPQPLVFSSKFLLLPPRSALPSPPRLLSKTLLRQRHALLLCCQKNQHAGNQKVAVAPSIFGASEFGRYVVTRFLADAYFYGHRPTVPIQTPPSWALCASFRLLIPASGSSLFAYPAYQNRPTRALQSRSTTLLKLVVLVHIRSLRIRRHTSAAFRLFILSTSHF